MESKITQTKKKDADAAFKKGKKALATSLFKWNPDHLGACMNFENAGKLYKEIGNDEMAKDSFLKAADSNEKTDQLSSAATAYAQAAFVEHDFEVSKKLLEKAQELYLIDGKGARGIKSIREFAKKMYEDYENKEMDDQTKLKRIMGLYKTIYDQILANQDYFIFNTDVVDEYLNMLIKNDMIYEGIEARRSFIKMLKDTKQQDHQIRRAYLEVQCMYVIVGEKFKLKQVLQEFFRDAKDAYKEQEYGFAESLKEALDPGEGASDEDQDWKQVRELLKKPVFSFLNNEIVKKVKLIAIMKAEEQERREQQSNLPGESEEAKVEETELDPVSQAQNEEGALDDMLL